MRVGGKVPRHPVENHTDAGGVTAIDETRKRGRIAERGLRRVLTEYLVAPGAAERMPHYRQQFDVGEAQAGNVGDQLIAELIPVQRPPAVLRYASPRFGMHLVDRQRRMQQRAVGGPSLEPARVIPAKRRWIRHHGGRARRYFHLQRDRIGLKRQ